MPFLRARSSTFCSACSPERTKNVPMMEASIPMAAMTMGIVTPEKPYPAATASAAVDTMEPT